MPVRQERRHNGGNSNSAAKASTVKPVILSDSLPTRPKSAMQHHTRLGVQTSVLSDGTKCGNRISLSHDETYHGMAKPQVQRVRAHSSLGIARRSLGIRGASSGKVGFLLPQGQESAGRPSDRPSTAGPPQLKRLASNLRVHSHTEWKDVDTTVWHSVPDSRYPWRDPSKQLSSTTSWADPVDATIIRPERPQTAVTTTEIGHPVGETSNFHTTARGRMEDGMLPWEYNSTSSDIADGKKRTRPNTALGISTTSSRPAIETLIPVERPPTAKIIEPKHLETIRNKIYENGVGVRKVFRKFDTNGDNVVSADEFRKGMKYMKLGLDQPMINGLLKHLDPHGRGEIDYEEFIDALKIKETDGAYNAFLVERTYFDGKKDVEPLRERVKQWTAEDVKEAFDLKRRVAIMMDQKFLKASEMFRSLDDDHNGALDAKELAIKLKQFNVDVRPDEVDRMIDVLQFSKPGCITYQDFIDHFKVPDKWGFCSAFSDFLPLGKSGEGPTPMDSTTMQKTVWRRQGRLTPYEILKRKKRHLNELVEEGKVLKVSQEVPTIVLPGKVSKGYLDEFLLKAFKTKLQTMRASTRDMYRILDPHKEGRVSRDNFHVAMKRMNMGIPASAVNDLMHYFDTDDEGFISMQEFAKVMDPDLEDSQRPFPDHSHEDRAEMRRLMKGGSHPEDPVGRELHPMAKECLETGDVKPELIALIQRAIETKSRSMRQVFRLWDKDHDGYLTLTEMRKGMAEMNLGLPHSVIAKVANVMDVDGNGKLDYNEFVNALKVADKTGAESVSHPRGYGYVHKAEGGFEHLLKKNIAYNTSANAAAPVDETQHGPSPHKATGLHHGKSRDLSVLSEPLAAGIVHQHRDHIENASEYVLNRSGDLLQQTHESPRKAAGLSLERPPRGRNDARTSRPKTSKPDKQELYGPRAISHTHPEIKEQKPTVTAQSRFQPADSFSSLKSTTTLYQTLSRDELRQSWADRTAVKKEKVMKQWEKLQSKRERASPIPSVDPALGLRAGVYVGWDRERDLE